jgi:hypothetical protein
MKNLFNNISQEEKNRILEMHSGKKNVMTEQSIDGAIDWVKDKVKSILPNSGSSFKAQATVEGDMVMEFPVIKFHYDNNGVEMFIKNMDGKTLYVHSSGTEFKGPIFDTQSGKKKYTDSIFTNIDTTNWKSIAKKHNIPVSEVMV